MVQQRTCKYGCNTTLGEFDTAENKFRELDGTLHTKSRCESLKPKQVPNGHNGNEKQYKMKQVRIGTITDDLAEQIGQALDDSGIIAYRRIGPKLIDVYAEKQEWL